MKNLMKASIKDSSNFTVSAFHCPYKYQCYSNPAIINTGLDKFAGARSGIFSIISFISSGAPKCLEPNFGIVSPVSQINAKWYTNPSIISV